MEALLYQKYRSRKFRDIIGQDKTRDALLKRSKEGKLPSAIYLHGNTGVGKTSLAYLIAMASVCEKLEEGEPCGVCKNCQGVINKTLSSVKEFTASTDVNTDFVRWLNDEVKTKSVFGTKKIFIINEFQDIWKNQSARRSFLGVLEEILQSSRLIITAMDDGKVEKANKDRMLSYKLLPINWKDVSTYLYDICKREGVPEDKINPEVIMAIAEHNMGSLRGSLIHLERVIESDLWTEDLVFKHLDIASGKMNTNLLQALVNKDLKTLLSFPNLDESYIATLTKGVEVLVRIKSGAEVGEWEKRQANVNIKDISLNQLNDTLTLLNTTTHYPYISPAIVTNTLASICKVERGR